MENEKVKWFKRYLKVSEEHKKRWADSLAVDKLQEIRVRSLTNYIKNNC